MGKGMRKRWMADELNSYIDDLHKQLTKAGFHFSKTDVQKMLPIIFSRVSFKNQQVVLTVDRSRRRAYNRIKWVGYIPEMNP